MGGESSAAGALHDGRRCVCFSLCTSSQAQHFLQHLPTYVTSPLSPWLLYLATVYGRTPELPFDLSRLRWLYHNTARWQRHHPTVPWPMAACRMGLLSGANQTDTPVRKGSWGPGKEFMTDKSKPQCAPEYCSKWQTAERHRDLQGHFYTRHYPSAGIRFQQFWSASDLDSFGGRWTETLGTVWWWSGEMMRIASPTTANEQGNTSLPTLWGQRGFAPQGLEDGSWVEVIRWQRGLPTPEGRGGFGVFFSPAAGSGTWLNLGRTRVFRDKSDALTSLRAMWKTSGQAGWELYKGRNVTTDSCAPVDPRTKGGIFCDKELSQQSAFYAYALGLDSYQVLQAFARSNEIVVTSRAATLVANCRCDGCSPWRTLQECGRWAADSISSCGHLEIRLGLPAEEGPQCECVHEAEVLACANGPIGSPASMHHTSQTHC